jgi:hypothetical protein
MNKAQVARLIMCWFHQPNSMDVFATASVPTEVWLLYMTVIEL